MPSEMFILRHGQTEFNAQGRLQGHCDSPLTALGRAQARAYGETLHHLGGLDDFALVSSPLGRAMATAAIVAETLGRTADSVIAEPRVKEAGLGEWEHGSIMEIQRNAPRLAGLPGWYLEAPGAESLAAIRARLAHWLADPLTPDKVIVISHGVTGVVLRGLLLALDDQAMWAQDKPQDAFYHFSGGQLSRVANKPHHIL